mmetsp:Transcript_21381/g.52338  ORF Transcript_21381/g.52338 Transcript_21381/m.52338 type:complete len:147 (-) Transcript_21381:149-589(-)
MCVPVLWVSADFCLRLSLVSGVGREPRICSWTDGWMAEGIMPCVACMCVCVRACEYYLIVCVLTAHISSPHEADMSATQVKSDTHDRCAGETKWVSVTHNPSTQTSHSQQQQQQQRPAGHVCMTTPKAGSSLFLSFLCVCMWCVSV